MIHRLILMNQRKLCRPKRPIPHQPLFTVPIPYHFIESLSASDASKSEFIFVCKEIIPFVIHREFEGKEREQNISHMATPPPFQPFPAFTRSSTFHLIPNISSIPTIPFIPTINLFLCRKSLVKVYVLCIECMCSISFHFK